NVQIGANVLDLSAGNVVLRLVDGTDFSAPAAVALGGNSILRLEQSGTLHNLSLTLGTAAAPGNAALQLYGGQTVTLAPSGSVTARSSSPPAPSTCRPTSPRTTSARLPEPAARPASGPPRPSPPAGRSTCRRSAATSTWSAAA